MKTLIKKLGLAVLVLLGILCSNKIMAQDEASETASDKIEANLTAAYNNVNGNNRDVTARLTKKDGKKWLPVKGVELALYLNSTDNGGLIAKVKTNQKGDAVFVLNQNARFNHVKDSAGVYVFTVQLRNQKEFDDADAELNITESKMELAFTEDADVKTATATFSVYNEKKELVPLKDAQVKFFVQRTYSLLPLSESAVATDDAGVASVEVPAGIAGDVKGVINIIARLEENETYGAVISKQDKNWGLPVAMDEAAASRTLWGSRANAPLVLVIGVNAILIGIWGIVGYIIFLLFEVYYLGTEFGVHHKNKHKHKH